MLGTAPDAAERALVGAVILSGGNALDDLEIDPGDFRDPGLAAVYELLRAMRTESRPIDAVTVWDAIESRQDPILKRFTAVDIHSLIQETPSAASATAYEAIVERDAMARRLKAAAAKLSSAAESDAEADEMIELARRAVDDAAGTTRMRTEQFADAIARVIDSLETPVVRQPTPWSELNELIGGFQPGRLYTFGARPGVGKTAVALQCALSLAQTGAVAYNSLEMDAEELVYRALSMRARITANRLSRGALSASDWERIARAHQSLGGLPLYVDDRADVTLQQIRQHARAVARRTPLSGVILDYLQLMKTERGDRRPRHEIVSDFSRQLKILARDLGVPVIVLSQLNRASTQRADSRPQLTDLRESGSIEQDSDVVALLHRDLTNPDKARTLHILVAKNRQGQTGWFSLDFIGEFTEARSRQTIERPGY